MFGGSTTNLTGTADLYTNANPTLVTLGGIPAGSTFDHRSMQQMWDALLYPYQAPTVSLVLNPAAGTYEVGVSIAAPILTPTTTRHSNSITSLTLSRSGTGLIHTYPSPNPAGGTEAPYTDVSGAVTSNTTYTATVGDGTSTGNGTASYVFQTKIYHGVSNTVINTGAGIMANFAASGVFATGRAATYNFDASVGTPPNYLYIAYPATYGPASPALPPSTFGGFAFSDFTSVTSPLTNASGHTENYIILKTNFAYNGPSYTWVIL